MNVKILFNKSAQEALFEGIDELANAVSSTLGPKGHSVFIDKKPYRLKRQKKFFIFIVPMFDFTA